MKHVACEAILGVSKITTWKPQANQFLLHGFLFLFFWVISSHCSSNQDLVHVIILFECIFF